MLYLNFPCRDIPLIKWNIAGRPFHFQIPTGKTLGEIWITSNTKFIFNKRFKISRHRCICSFSIAKCKRPSCHCLPPGDVDSGKEDDQRQHEPAGEA